jgi:hypothetical protein
MNRKNWRSILAASVGVLFAAAATSPGALAQKVQRPYRTATQQQGAMRSETLQDTNQTNAPQQETVTLDVRGAASRDDAQLLGWTLTVHQIKAAVQKSQDKPFRITTAIDPHTDLGAVGRAVAATKTADKAQAPPSLDLVLFGKLDSKSAKQASEALAKIKGVDAKDSTADTKAGEINVRIEGGAKLTADQIRRALHDAGVTTQFTRYGERQS